MVALQNVSAENVCFNEEGRLDNQANAITRRLEYICDGLRNERGKRHIEPNVHQSLQSCTICLFTNMCKCTHNQVPTSAPPPQISLLTISPSSEPLLLTLISRFGLHTHSLTIHTFGLILLISAPSPRYSLLHDISRFWSHRSLLHGSYSCINSMIVWVCP